MRERHGGVVLVELPFAAWNSPSIGLSILRSVLRREGYSCSIDYTNLKFAHLIGLKAYETISWHVPAEFLMGDLLFAPQLSAKGGCFQSLVGKKGGRDLYQTEVPQWLWHRMPVLQETASSFIDQIASEIIDREPLLVGLSAMFQVVPSLVLARKLKRIAPSLPLIIGGANCDSSMGKAIHERFRVHRFRLLR